MRGKALVEKHLGKKFFNLIPDLDLRQGQERAIGDIKWKLLDQDDPKNKYGISQTDIYQLFAYSRKYLATQRQRKVILIYPRTDNFNVPLRPFWYQENEEVLYVLPYDLDEDRLIADEDFFLADITNERRSSAAA